MDQPSVELIINDCPGQDPPTYANQHEINMYLMIDMLYKEQKSWRGTETLEKQKTQIKMLNSS